MSTENELVERAIQGARLDREWVRAECPFCEEEGHRDRKRSLAVNVRSGRWRCLRCQMWGYLDYDTDLPAFEDTVEEEQIEFPEMAPPPEYIPLWNDRSYSLRPARVYLKSRAVSRQMAKELQIGACVDGFWRCRVIVPFLNPADQWLGWVGRVWLNPLPQDGILAVPYLYPKDMPRGEFFWNHRALLERTDHPLLVVEGVFDAMPYYPHAIACLGKPSHKQRDLLSTAQRPIVFALDGDSWEESLMYATQLRFDGQSAGTVRFPPKKDPAEVDPAWTWKQARKSLKAASLL